MKTLTTLFFALLTTISSFASAEDPISTSIEDKTVTIYFNKEKSETVTVSIVDNEGVELLSEKVLLKNHKTRSYNLEQLPFGIYTIVVDSDQRVVYKKVKTARNNSIVLNEIVNHKPTSFYEDNVWKINAMALGQNVVFKIFNSDNKQIFEDRIKAPITLSKIYNLSNLKKGVYNLSVTIGNTNYDNVIIKTK